MLWGSGLNTLELQHAYLYNDITLKLPRMKGRLALVYRDGIETGNVDREAAKLPRDHQRRE